MNVVMHCFSMGNYTAYVWSAYGCALGVLILNGLTCYLQKKRIKKSLQQWMKQISQ